MFAFSVVDLTLENDPEITVRVEYELQTDPRWPLDFCEPFYIFECNIDHTDNNAFFDVQWYANGNVIFEFVDENGLSSNEMPSQITSEQLLARNYKIGTTVNIAILSLQYISINHFY